MKTRFFSVLVLALGIALSVSISSEKGQKSSKATSAKKEMKSCCPEEKGNKQCSDKDMKDCAAKEGKGMKSSKSSSTKEADKGKTTGNENKKN